ncbi:hypothetical protein [Thalassobacillus hwangdonensis]|uniref:Uncharacterized protein n=1 Tax=Thalassobacillus hwangdonensis TaxID=546108 RepID=A0ABW3L8E4_9BACI
MGFLPLIINLIVFIIIIVVFSRFIKPNNKRARNFWYGKRIWKVFAGYAILLVVGAAIYLLIPMEGAMEAKTVSDKEMEAAERLDVEMTNKALAGNIEEIDESFKRKSWEFTIKSDVILVNHYDTHGLLVIAEHINGASDKIEVSYYQPQAYIKNIKVDHEALMPKLSSSDNHINIQKGAKSDFQAVTINHEYPVNQFREDYISGMVGESFIGGMVGRGLLYMKVPANKKVDGADHVIGN